LVMLEVLSRRYQHSKSYMFFYKLNASKRKTKMRITLEYVIVIVNLIKSIVQLV